MSELKSIEKALLNEAHFTNEMLCSGATQIRKANYASKGIYAQAFTSLSTGLERVGKLCFILDYYIDNDRSFPNPKELKKTFGHELLKLYQYSQDLIQRKSISFDFSGNISGSIHQEIIRILGEFAQGDRYCNINLLLGDQQQRDPIAKWFELVDTPLYEKHVTYRKNRKIADTALMHMYLNGTATVAHTSEIGEEILNIGEASFRTGVFQAVAPYRQLYILQIIRYWIEILSQLGSQAQVMGCREIPYFREIFQCFYNPDKYFRSRKTWP